MIVLEPISTSQVFNVIQRRSVTAGNKLEIIDEETNTSRVITLTSNATGDYYDTITLTISPALKEGHTYNAMLYHNTIGNYTWKGKIFCTAKDDVRDYSVNEGRYTENTTTNQFILND